jgi:hypothetical protein
VPALLGRIAEIETRAFGFLSELDAGAESAGLPR